jgi:hypothetical protein
MSTPVVGQLYFLEKRGAPGLLRVGQWLNRRGRGPRVVAPEPSLWRVLVDGSECVSDVEFGDLAAEYDAGDV